MNSIKKNVKCPLCWSKLSDEDNAFAVQEVEAVISSLEEAKKSINDSLRRFEFNLKQRLEQSDKHGMD